MKVKEHLNEMQGTNITAILIHFLHLKHSKYKISGPNKNRLTLNALKLINNVETRESMEEGNKTVRLCLPGRKKD